MRRNLSGLPSKMASSTQWPIFRSTRDYMQTCAFILKFYIILCIYLLITSFWRSIYINCYIDCRSKMNSIKTERLKWRCISEALMKILHLFYTSIAIICWTNAGILSAVLLARRRQMTLARCHFAHRANLIANRWFDVGPTPVAQQALHMPT